MRLYVVSVVGWDGWRVVPVLWAGPAASGEAALSAATAGAAAGLKVLRSCVVDYTAAEVAALLEGVSDG